MKVLFAIGDVDTAENIAKQYYALYGERLEHKDVFYFKSLLEEVKKDKTYDRIIIAEELEPSQNNVIDAKDQMLSTLKKVWMYILVGVGIGATIHNFIPAEWIQAVLGSDKWYAVPLATILGTPMYADIFGTIPVAEALFAKGVGVSRTPIRK